MTLFSYASGTERGLLMSYDCKCLREILLCRILMLSWPETSALNGAANILIVTAIVTLLHLNAVSPHGGATAFL